MFACLFNLQDLVDLMALATLFAFALVAACIIVLRYQPEENMMSAGSESGEVTGLLAGVGAQNNQTIRDVSGNDPDIQTTLRHLVLQSNSIPTSTTGRIVSWMTIFYGKVPLLTTGLGTSFPFEDE